MPITIKLGDTGDDVKRLQRVFARSKVLGSDSVDGVFGPETEQAVKDFQQAAGMTVTGTLAPSQVAVVPGAARVGAVTASVGDPASSPVLSLTRTLRVISRVSCRIARSVASKVAVSTVPVPNCASASAWAAVPPARRNSGVCCANS